MNNSTLPDRLAATSQGLFALVSYAAHLLTLNSTLTDLDLRRGMNLNTESMAAIPFSEALLALVFSEARRTAFTPQQLREWQQSEVGRRHSAEAHEAYMMS